MLLQHAVLYMAVTEKRTQLYLSAEQHTAVLRAARKRGTSMTWIVREALAEYLVRPAALAGEDHIDPLADLIGFVEGPGDLSLRHDDHLYGPARKNSRASRKKR